VIEGQRWAVRAVPPALRKRYLAQGWWTDETLGALVDRSLAAAPEATINVWSATQPRHGTYADIHVDARRLVTALADAGLMPGDVVAFQLPNWWEAVVAFYGLAMGGYVLVPIVPIYGHKEVRFILAESGARAYISADQYGHVDFLDIVDGAKRDELPALDLHIVVGEGATPARVQRFGWDHVARCEPAATVATVDPDDVCVLAYTSGTTSNPKGVMHTHRTLFAELLHMRPWMTPGKPNLMGSPVAHATGMLGAVLSPMQLGENIHLIDRWDPARVLDVMLEADIGAGTGASVFLSTVIDHPDFTPAHAQRIHRVGLGGAPVPLALAERAAAHGIAIIRAYGSTEHPSITGCSFDDPAEKRHRTDGRPLVGVEVRLVDADGAHVSAGEPGEIWSRGPDLCAGYTDPALTARAFDDDGWYHTGDMGVADADGFITITDRLNDVIIRGGENLSAAEIEGAIGAMPEVAEVAVVAMADERLGERACAVVRLTPDVPSLELAAITDHLAGLGLARQKWPEALEIVADFPRTASGKVRKVDLRRTLAQPDARAPRSHTVPPCAIDVEPLAGAIGAEISGVDLASDLDDRTVAEIRRAWLEHLVVFFRDQELTPDAFLAFARRIGEPVEYPFVSGIDGYPEIIAVAKLPHETVNFGGIWHSDTVYLEQPPMATLLVAREVPPHGGDTMFANMYAAYDALSPAMRHLLDGLTAVNSSALADVSKTREDRIRDSGLADKKDYISEHPVVRTHPETGRKALYVNVAHTARFAGMTEDESRPLLRFLFEHSVKPEFTCRFRWRVGSLALWDNRCAMHNPINDYHGYTRRMHRITLAGDVPC
jgi:acyl-CoA synthetase (AMP-forming)/AMP-acid ligase II/alpha-ketoglutarate-dependent taurine dioxygenase